MYNKMISEDTMTNLFELVIDINEDSNIPNNEKIDIIHVLNEFIFNGNSKNIDKVMICNFDIKVTSNYVIFKFTNSDYFNEYCPMITYDIAKGIEFSVFSYVYDKSVISADITDYNIDPDDNYLNGFVGFASDLCENYYRGQLF